MGAISGWVEVWTDYHCTWPLLLERGIIFSFSMIVVWVYNGQGCFHLWCVGLSIDWGSKELEPEISQELSWLEVGWYSILFQSYVFSGSWGWGGATSAPFPWKGIWSVKVPNRVLFFLWTVALGKILSFDNLTKWGLPLVNWCCMCWSNGESMDHLLIHCDITFALWGVLFQMLGIWWVLPGNVISFLFSWRNWFGKYGLDIWNMVLACLEGA